MNISGHDPLHNGKICWRSPSNIALIKYWGKKGFQLPANASLSMTLNRSYTELELEYAVRDNSDGLSLQFWFEGDKQEKFEKKIKQYLDSLSGTLNFLSSLDIKIRSHNTFPHSTGIASSASSMSALALCITTLEQVFGRKNPDSQEFYERASALARLASGSACRSLYGGYALWGRTDQVAGSSDEYAVPCGNNFAPVFHDLRDAVLIVSTSEKEVTSRAGHEMMVFHPFATSRYAQAVRNMENLLHSMEEGDFEAFSAITESEALTIHAMMMTSAKSCILVEPETLNIIKEIRHLREQKGIPVCFTLDAGPNIHLLYPTSFEKQVKAWIERSLLDYCEDNKWIDDQLGNGPQQIYPAI